MARSICRRCDHGASDRFQKFVCDRMRRPSQPDSVKAGEGEIGDVSIRLLRYNESQRPGPERGRQLFRSRGENADATGRAGIGDMRDQWIEGGASLGRVKPRDRGAIAGIGAEPINGLGGKDNQAAGGQAT